MIGPIGLILHMAGALVVGLVAGAYGMLGFAAKAVAERANSRGFGEEYLRIVETETSHQARLRSD